MLIMWFKILKIVGIELSWMIVFLDVNFKKYYYSIIVFINNNWGIYNNVLWN